MTSQKAQNGPSADIVRKVDWPEDYTRRRKVSLNNDHREKVYSRSFFDVKTKKKGSLKLEDVEKSMLSVQNQSIISYREIETNAFKEAF